MRKTHNPEVDQALKRESDRRAMEAFTRGLFGELGHQVRIRFPKSYQEAVTLAIAMRDVERRPTDDSKRPPARGVFMSQNPIKCHNCGRIGHKSFECRVNPNKNISSNSNFSTHQTNSRFSESRQAPKKCTFCNRLGHWEVECRTKQRQFPSSTSRGILHCRSCGRRGHEERYCRINPPQNFAPRTQTEPTNTTGGSKPAVGTPQTK